MTSITNLKNEQKRKFDHVVCIMSTFSTYFSGREFIRRLDFNHLTSMYNKWAPADFDVNLFLVEGEKLIFCGPEIDDGCKTT